MTFKHDLNMILCGDQCGGQHFSRGIHGPPNPPLEGATESESFQVNTLAMWGLFHSKHIKNTNSKQQI